MDWTTSYTQTGSREGGAVVDIRVLNKESKIDIHATFAQRTQANPTASTARLSDLHLGPVCPSHKKDSGQEIKAGVCLSDENVFTVRLGGHDVKPNRARNGPRISTPTGIFAR